MAVRSICGVILITDNPKKLADFYSEALDVPFEREEHGDLDVHFGADIMNVHFGIHPPGNFKREKAGNGRPVVIAFNVHSIGPFQERLTRLGAEILQETHDEGFGLATSYLDPDGNVLELTELSYQFGSDEEE